MAKALTILSLLVLAACQTSGGDFCHVEHAIRPTRAEIAAMSDATVAQILAHNRKGQSLCGWKP